MKISYKTERIKDILAVTLILGFAIFYFRDTIFFKKVFSMTDIMFQNYPWAVIMERLIRQGHLPLWIPHLFCGFPLLAEGQVGGLYPLNIIVDLVLPTHYSFFMNIPLHFCLLSISMYFLLRLNKLWTISSLIGAFTFSYGGVNICHILHVNMIKTIAWLPLICIFIGLAVRKNRLVYAVFGGIFVGLSILAGHFQVFFYTMVIVVSYFLLKVWEIYSNNKDKKIIFNSLLFFLWMIIIGLGISAIQLLPNFELYNLSIRAGGIEYSEATYCSLPFKNIIMFIMPYFFGICKCGTYWGEKFFWEYCGYIGLLPLVLAGFGIFSPRRKILAKGFFIIFIISLFLALGENNPVYSHLYKLLFLNLFRVPARFLFISTFSLSFLTALGCQRILDLRRTGEWQKLKRYKKIISFIFFQIIILILFVAIPFYSVKSPAFKSMFNNFLLFILGTSIIIYLLGKYYSNKINSNFLGGAFLILLLIDLSWFGFMANAEMGLKKFLNEPNIIKKLEEDRAPFYRVFGLPRDFGAEYFIYQADGDSPLRFKRYDSMMKKAAEGDNYKILNFMNVKYTVYGAIAKDFGYEMVFSEGNETLYLNKDCLPRAFIVPGYIALKEKSKVIDQLLDVEFKPEEYVVLEEHPPLAVDYKKASGDSKCRIVDYKMNEVLIEAELDGRGFLFLSDTYYPGWQVYIDGQKGRIYQANYLFRAVLLDTGKHLVKFVYRPFTFRIGAFISLFTFLISVIIVVKSAKKAR